MSLASSPSNDSAFGGRRLERRATLSRETVRQAVEAIGQSFVASRGDELDAESVFRDSALLFFRLLAGELARKSEASSAHDTLSTSYEHLLRYRPSIASGQFMLRRNTDRRKRTGSFYTPSHLARTTVEVALQPLLRGAACSLPRVLDPAMGTGTFLVEAGRYLAERLGPEGYSMRDIAERCLFGVDRDPIAVELAVLSLCLETGAEPGVLTRHVRCGDLLAGLNAPLGQFDSVVGNPPWGVPYGVEERARLKERFPCSTSGTFDSFKLFVDLGSMVSRGTVGMVVPQAVLAQASHRDVRAMLLDRLDPYYAADLGDGVFPGAAAPACILVFGPKPGPQIVPCADLRRGREGAQDGVPTLLWRARSGFPLRAHGRLDLLHRLEGRHLRLGELAHCYRVRDVGINYNRAAVARRVLYAGPVPDDPRDLARYRGRNFARYSAVHPGGWLRYNARELLETGETLAMDGATYRLSEKIVFRQTADRIVATLDRSRMAMGRSVIAITGERGGSLRALLACLNSRLLTLLYRALAGEEGRVLPQVKVGMITALPLPAVCAAALSDEVVVTADAVDEARCGDGEEMLRRAALDPVFGWSCLDRLADHLLACEGQDAQADALVDQVVYRLYGLTGDEIALVDRA